MDLVLAKLDVQAAEIAALRERVVALEARLASASQASEFELISSPPTSSEAGGTQVLSSSGVSEERRGIARGIGLWLKRFLSGGNRGSSGRDQINLPSKLYLVVRDINLKVYSPPLIFFTWQEAKNFCVVRGQPSESIFVGLPSKEEARVALAAGGFDFPAALQR